MADFYKALREAMKQQTHLGLTAAQMMRQQHRELNGGSNG